MKSSENGQKGGKRAQLAHRTPSGHGQPTAGRQKPPPAIRLIPAHDFVGAESGRSSAGRLGHRRGNLGNCPDRPPRRDRSAQHARTWELIPGATFYEAQLRDDVQSRRLYFEGAWNALKACPIVFLDPDNGIEIPSKRLGTKDSAKYVYWGEITRAYERGHSLVIYQHFVRESRDAFIARVAAQLAERLQAPLVDSFRTAHVVFFLVARPEHAAAFDRAHKEIHERWSGQILASAHVAANPAVGVAIRAGPPAGREDMLSAIASQAPPVRWARPSSPGEPMNDRPGYGDAEAKQIIERATDIELQQGQRLDARALREIGTEAGISQSAIERAIEEHESAAPAKAPWLKRHRARIITALIIAAVVVIYTLLRQTGPLSP